jgi:molybdate transport system substrate-binding protein
MKLLLSLVIACGLLAGTSAQAGQVQVAVAANFSEPMRELARRFEARSGHKALLTFGATGKFYAQVRNGAPFEVLLAADQRTPQRLDEDGAAVPGSRFTYAIGKLVLWSPKADLVDAQGAVLRDGPFRHLAVASANTAPYGAAALQVLERLGLREQLNGRMVIGENITQTYQFVASGNAELGFVALSQVMVDGVLREGSAWFVPQDFYAMIQQDAVLLAKGSSNPAAQALMEYLRGEEAAQIIRRYGYEL